MQGKKKKKAHCKLFVPFIPTTYILPKSETSYLIPLGYMSTQMLSLYEGIRKKNALPKKMVLTIGRPINKSMMMVAHFSPCKCYYIGPVCFGVLLHPGEGMQLKHIGWYLHGAKCATIIIILSIVGGNQFRFFQMQARKAFSVSHQAWSISQFPSCFGPGMSHPTLCCEWLKGCYQV